MYTHKRTHMLPSCTISSLISIIIIPHCFLFIFFVYILGQLSLLSQWEDLESKAFRLKKQLNSPQSNFAFAFIEVRKEEERREKE